MKEKGTFKTLLLQIKQYKKDSLLTPVFMILEVFTETLIPFLMASIIDKGVEAHNIGHIYKIGGFMLIAAVFSLVFGILGGKYGARASAGFARNLRKAMYENIQKFSFSNIDKFSTSGLITRLTTDVTNVQNAYMMVLRMCMRAPVSLICALGMAFFISAKVSSIFVVAMLFLAVIMSFVIKFSMQYFSAAFAKYDALNESVQENVSAIRVVKAYVREDYEKEKFAKASDGILKIFTKAENVISFINPSMTLAIYGCILAIGWVGAHMIVQNELTTGELMSLFAYCMNILMSLMMLAFIFVMLMMSTASARRISEVLNEKAEITNGEKPLYEVTDGSIEFRDVTFRYHKESEDPVLNHISIQIHSGETIGIIGGTGSAKSTFVNLISRLYDADEGEVIVGGKNVKEYDLETLRNMVAVVLQNNVLFSGTVLENLRWGKKDATEEECRHACKLACADEFIQKMPEKYHTYIEQGGTNVSGGQKQRLCIARALLKSPKILILDDSTSAVDTATDAKIKQAFAKEIPGTTKLIIAQRIASVQYADRIIVFRNGNVDGFGTHEELLATNEIYREVFESQNQGSGDFDEKEVS